MRLNRTFQRCLILVPHPDDETNIAGSLIHELRRAKTDLFIAYATNGDNRYPAKLRQKEVLAALEVLGGVEKDHIFFLGYGDAWFDETHGHIFYTKDQAARSKAGYSETYGTDLFQDFAMQQRGKHSPYAREAYCRDLKELILLVKADLILCSDLDEHPDHRMLTLCFDEVMGEILKAERKYHPTVLKAFAYSTAYSAIPDFNENPFRVTIRPEIGKTEHYSYDLIDRLIYEWENRISLPVAKAFTERRLSRNIGAKALAQHRTQPAAGRAERILNRDEVYWQRRTDSLSYAAQVTASSGCAEYLNDFRLYNVTDIDSRVPVFGEYLWEPEEEDEKREFTFEWEETQKISVITLYGDLNAEEESGEISVLFDSGEMFTGRLPAQGRQLTILLTTIQTKKCSVRVPKGTGIAECEFFEALEEPLQEMEKPTEVREITAFERWMNRGWVFLIKVRHKVWEKGAWRILSDI